MYGSKEGGGGGGGEGGGRGWRMETGKGDREQTDIGGKGEGMESEFP